MRVLTAVRQQRSPHAEDVDELKRIMPMHAHLPLDELACNVINEFVAARRKIRVRRAG